MKSGKLKLTSLIALSCFVLLLFGGSLGLPVLGGENDASLSEDMGVVIPLYVDGIWVGQGVLVGNTTYMPIRAFCDQVYPGAEVSWDPVSKTAQVSDLDLQLTAVVGSKYIVANDRCFYLPDGVKTLDGSVMIPLRELAVVFGVQFDWNPVDWSVNLLLSSHKPLMWGGEFYNSNDLLWLSRLIYIESGNQIFEGQMAVGNVVLNRVAHWNFPDTVEGVIFDTRGSQFYTRDEPAIYNSSSPVSILAAKACLEGYNTAGESLFYLNPVTAAPEGLAFFNGNLTYVMTIGEHAFYQ